VSKLVNKTRSQRLHNIAKASRALKSGELAKSDPQLAKLLNGLEEVIELSDLGGDYYYLQPAYKGSNNEDKYRLVPRDRVKDKQQDPLTHAALAQTQKFYNNGGKNLVNPPNKQLAVERAAELIEKYLVPSNIKSIGGRLGVRETPSDKEALGRTASLLADLDRGYNSRIGYAYGGMPIDAGHMISHISRPDLSNSPHNIEFQNAYVNRGQSGIEKLAGNQNREPTNEELAEALFRSHLNKILDGVVLPGRKGSKERNEYMAAINAKLQ